MSAPPALDADGRGGLTLGGARYLLIRPETVVGLQKAVEGALGERAAACITAGGRAGGAKAAAALHGTAEERVGRLLRIGSEIGWGEFAHERLTARPSWPSACAARPSPRPTGRRRARSVT